MLLYSDKTLQALSKHIQHELLPAVDEDDDDNGNVAAMLPIDVVEDAVKCVAGRVNYGLDVQAEGCKAPAAWTIWRWEVPDEFWEWLPKAAREKADNRFKERQQVRVTILLGDTRPTFDLSSNVMFKHCLTRCLKKTGCLSWARRWADRLVGSKAGRKEFLLQLS